MGPDNIETFQCLFTQTNLNQRSPFLIFVEQVNFNISLTLSDFTVNFPD